MSKISSKKSGIAKPIYIYCDCMDVLNAEQRHRNMCAIKSKNTKPELIVRKILFSLGYRYRVHQHHLPGSPDIVLPKYKTAIFVNGCFWHRHRGCKYATMPATNKMKWKQKFTANVKRDQNNLILLRQMNWNILTIWSCETMDPDRLCRIIRTCPFLKKSSE